MSDNPPSQPLQGSVSYDATIGQSDPNLYTPTPQGYGALQGHPVQPYVLQPGTIDLSSRQIIDNNAEGNDPRNYGSEYSSRQQLPVNMSLPDGTFLPQGSWMSYPTIYQGTLHNEDEAFNHAVATGEHLGIYSAATPPHVLDDAETRLHARDIYINGKKLNGDMWAAMKKRKISEIKRK